MQRDICVVAGADPGLCPTGVRRKAGQMRRNAKGVSPSTFDPRLIAKTFWAPYRRSGSLTA